MKRVLSLRGGGIRGVATAVLLAEVERVTKKPICESFDLLAGTSVGGIMAIGLALKLPAEQLVEFFEIEGPKIFADRKFGRFFQMLGHPRYQIEHLISALERHFDAGDTQTLMAHVYQKVMVTSTRFRGLESRIWKSWKHTDLRCVTAAASSAAAPSYFNPVSISDFAHCDGGCWGNNPAAVAAVEAKKLWPYWYFNIVDIACPASRSDFEPTRGGVLDYVPHLTDMFIGSGEDVMSYIAKQFVGQGKLVSIQPELFRAKHDLGNTSKSNIQELKNCARYDLDRNLDLILGCLEMKSIY